MKFIIIYLLVGLCFVLLAFFTTSKMKRKFYLVDKKHFIKTTILIIFIYPIYFFVASKEVIMERIKWEDKNE